MALLLANRYTARIGSTSYLHQRLPSSERSKLSTLQEGLRTGLRPMPNALLPHCCRTGPWESRRIRQGAWGDCCRAPLLVQKCDRGRCDVSYVKM